MEFYFAPASPDHIRRERAKARELRQSQWWRQQLGKGDCYHCGAKFTKDDLTMDHLIPVVRGGTSSRNNVVVSCKPCNSAKGNLTRAELAMRGEI
jgi:5-methylcytosine-specific restriction enzyme A